MSDAIAQIKRAQAEAALKAKADYLLLADRLAKSEPAPPDVLDLLARAGKDADDLEAAVRIARERLALEPKVAAFGQIMKERAAVEAELKAAVEKADAELRAANARVDAVLAPLRKRVADLAEAERESRSARQRLQTLTGDLAKLSADPVAIAGGDVVRVRDRAAVVTIFDEE